MIVWEKVFPILAEAIPGFGPSQEEWEDCLCYPFISDMVRFVNDRTYLGTAESEHLARLLENLLTKGDGNVHDLAVDAIETVWGSENGRSIAEHFGQESKKIWDEIGRRGWCQ